MQLYWIWLAELPKLSPMEKRLLLEQYPSPEDLFFAEEAELKTLEHIRGDGLQELLKKDLTVARRVLEDCVNLDIELLTWEDPRFPARLRNISDPPLVLYYKGRLPDFSAQPVISVVGTRSATGYGLRTARNMGYQITNCGGLVVSGMAKGIDAFATEGALDAGGTAVGVLGCGVDRIYPSENRWLFDRMLRQGCLISEFIPGTQVFKWNFPRRNRIISGMSCGVLVVEAPERSGALITARQALEQGRDVFVVPGNVDEAACAGSNALLRDGAIMASAGWDVIQEYEAQWPDVVSRDDKRAPMRDRPTLQVAQPVQKPRITPRGDKKPVDNPFPEPYIVLDQDTAPLTQQEQSILEALGDKEVIIDELIENLGMDAGDALAALTVLQMKGLAMLIPGGRAMRIGSDTQG